jgi:hypothetical protein
LGAGPPSKDVPHWGQKFHAPVFSALHFGQLFKVMFDPFFRIPSISEHEKQKYLIWTNLTPKGYSVKEFLGFGEANQPKK